MPEAAEKIVADLQRNHRVDYDTSGAIGRRYRRQDEVGTPFCITVDGQTIEDGTVTLRERDSMQQVRLSADEISAEIARRLLA
jgi:glycyl-tRNA synthetase